MQFNSSSQIGQSPLCHWEFLSLSSNHKRIRTNDIPTRVNKACYRSFSISSPLLLQFPVLHRSWFHFLRPSNVSLLPPRKDCRQFNGNFSRKFHQRQECVPFSFVKQISFGLSFVVPQVSRESTELQSNPKDLQVPFYLPNV